MMLELMKVWSDDVINDSPHLRPGRVVVDEGDAEGRGVHAAKLAASGARGFGSQSV